MLITYIHRALVNGIRKVTNIRFFCYPCQRAIYYKTDYLNGTKDLLVGCKQCRKTKLVVPAYIFK